jgi:dolichol kinase
MAIRARKIYRIGVGCIFPLVYYFVSKKPILMGEFPVVKFVPLGIIAFFLILVIILEVERHKHPGLWPYIISKPYGKILKKKPGKILGTTYFLVGSFIVIAVFSNGVAIAVLLFNTFGDAVSAIIGTKYGKIKFFGGKKSLEGSLAFFVVSLIVGLILCNSPRVDLVLYQVAIGAITATLIEALPIPVDDNLTIPIISGTVMQVL